MPRAILSQKNSLQMDVIGFKGIEARSSTVIIGKRILLQIPSINDCIWLCFSSSDNDSSCSICSRFCPSQRSTISKSLASFVITKNKKNVINVDVNFKI